MTSAVIPWFRSCSYPNPYPPTPTPIPWRRLFTMPGLQNFEREGKGPNKGCENVTRSLHSRTSPRPRKLFFTRLTVPVLCLTLYCDFSKRPTCWAPSLFLFSWRFLAAVSFFALSTSFEQNANPEHKWATLKNTRLKKTKRQVTIA